MGFFKGLFNPTYGIVRSVIGLVLGIMITSWPQKAEATIVYIIGGALLLIGGISIGLSFRERAKHDGLMNINGIIDILLGIILVIFPGFFFGFLVYLFGAILLFFGISQLSALLSVRGQVPVSWLTLIFPIIISIIGLVFIIRPDMVREIIFQLFGIGLIAYSIAELISTLKMRKVMNMNCNTQQAEQTFIEDVAYEEVEKSDGEE
ncbi:MAG: DUF308 domain-containing protein [Bacteroidales bacterium]|nr:DUF308 domain-containing protein [Bacteroidales bacterium]